MQNNVLKNKNETIDRLQRCLSKNYFKDSFTMIV